MRNVPREDGIFTMRRYENVTCRDKTLPHLNQNHSLMAPGNCYSRTVSVMYLCHSS